MARQNPRSNTPAGGNVELTPEQESAIKDIKLKIETFTSELQKVVNKRGQIKNILDNFDDVVLGSIVVDTLPDENTEEITNSVIINQQEMHLAIMQKLLEYDIPFDGLGSEILNINTFIFNSNKLKGLTEISNELNEGETYSYLYQEILDSDLSLLSEPYESNYSGGTVDSNTLNLYMALATNTILDSEYYPAIKATLSHSLTEVIATI